MNPTILVAGTWEFKDYEEENKIRETNPDALPWWEPKSKFGRTALNHGIILANNNEPFIWSTNMDGVVGVNMDWYSAGMSLLYFANRHAPPIPGSGYQPVNIIAHSHGGQVAVDAICQGLLVDTLITVATPIRKDMERFRRKAIGLINKWVHIYSDEDKGIGWQILGELGAGSIEFQRALPEVAVDSTKGYTIYYPHTSHGGLIDFELWNKQNWWELIPR